MQDSGFYCSFRYAGAILWDDLSLVVRSAKDKNIFKSLLKTDFFRLPYNFIILIYFCAVPRILYTVELRTLIDNYHCKSPFLAKILV